MKENDKPNEEVTYTLEETYRWLYNIVASCNNDFHFKAADVLISLFIEKYGDNENAQSLKELRQNRWINVHTILV